MGAGGFNEMEKDAIGEIMNISLGASATAISTLLGAKANITTPTVKIQVRDEFSFKKLEPAIGVEIAYTEGLEGRNVMIFRREDVRIIVGILMGSEIPEEQFEMDEVTISAICEVMNQMMGSSATALSEFLGTTVNISTPRSFVIDNEEKFKEDYFPAKDSMVVVSFILEIEGKLKSEFLNIMSMDLARRLLKPFEDTLKEEQHVSEDQRGEEDGKISSEKAVTETEKENIAGGQASVQKTPLETSAQQVPPAVSEMNAQQVPPAVPEMNVQQVPPAMPETNAQQIPQMNMGMYAQQPFAPTSMDPVMMQLLNQMQQTQSQMMELMKDMRKTDGRNGNRNQESGNLIRPLSAVALDEGGSKAGEDDEYTNQEMLMQVPLEVSVEIGRTKKKVKDILEFTQGSLVVLDKMAGEQVDLFVNGQCIARGDIVVVEDNFGVRITEIVSKAITEELV